MRVSRGALVGGLAFALVAGAVAFVLLNFFEYVPYEQEVEPSVQALRDPWLALGRSLDGMAALRRYKAKDAFDPASCSLLVADAADLPRFFPDGDAMARWVAAGGRLVVSCPPNYGDGDGDDDEDWSDGDYEDSAEAPPSADANPAPAEADASPAPQAEAGQADASPQSADAESQADADQSGDAEYFGDGETEAAGGEAAAEPEPDAGAKPAPTARLPAHPLFAGLEPATVDPNSWAEAEARLVVRAPGSPRGTPDFISADRRVELPAAAADGDTTLYQDAGHTLAALRHWGEGYLLVTGKAYALQNRGLADGGNRDLAALLCAGADGRRAVWLPAPEAAPVVRFDLAAVALALAVLAAVLVWHAAPRLGPVIPDRPTQRRSLRERFLSEGRFLWKVRCGGQLIGQADANPSKAAFVKAVRAIVETENQSKKRNQP